MLSPFDFEARQLKLNKAGVQETSGSSHPALLKQVSSENVAGCICGNYRV
jgi:hypothetical protein